MANSLVSRARERLVRAACACVSAAVLFMVLFWVFSGSLEDIETIYAGAILILIMGGIAWLASRRLALASWLLVGLLTLIITADIFDYGIGSPGASGYIIPVVLAACCLGLWAGLGVCAFSCIAVWVAAWGTTSGGWFDPPAPVDHLTFNAPALTVILLATALIVGLWGKSLEKMIDR
ncbi:MAG: hypothetical protein JW726_14655 [Anaerolineales bacterium]|nr:hypothetical protein [Anaerolineales bacterium]